MFGSHLNRFLAMQEAIANMYPLQCIPAGRKPTGLSGTRLQQRPQNEVSLDMGVRMGIDKGISESSPEMDFKDKLILVQNWFAIHA